MVEGLVGEAGADIADVDQVAIGVVGAEEHRAERAGASASARTPATHHHLGRLGQRMLDPQRRARAGLVGRVETFGHHTFEAVLGRGRQQLLRAEVVAGVAGRDHQGPVRRVQQLGEQLTALLVRLRGQRPVVDPQDVEREVGHRDFGELPRRRDALGAALHQLELGPSRLVDRDDFAVEDGRPAVQGRSEHAAKLRVVRGQVVAVAAGDPGGAVRGDLDAAAEAVPLPLVGVHVVVRQPAVDGQHRRDRVRRPLRHTVQCGLSGGHPSSGEQRQQLLVAAGAAQHRQTRVARDVSGPQRGQEPDDGPRLGQDLATAEVGQHEHLLTARRFDPGGPAVHLVPEQCDVAVRERAQPPVHRQVGRDRDVDVHGARLVAEPQRLRHAAEVGPQAALEPVLEIGIDLGAQRSRAFLDIRRTLLPSDHA